MGDGKLRPTQAESNVKKEALGLLLLVIGIIGVIVGVAMVWGRGGVLLLVGAALTWVGARLCIYKTEKE